MAYQINYEGDDTAELVAYLHSIRLRGEAIEWPFTIRVEHTEGTHEAKIVEIDALGAVTLQPVTRDGEKDGDPITVEPHDISEVTVW